MTASEAIREFISHTGNALSALDEASGEAHHFAAAAAVAMCTLYMEVAHDPFQAAQRLREFIARGGEGDWLPNMLTV